MNKPQLQVFADDFVFLEGPRWRFDRLWVSDVNGKRVYTLTEDGARSLCVEVPTRPSGIGFLPDGTPLVVSMKDRTLQRVENGRLVEHASVAHLVEGEINDMVGGAKFKPGNLVLVTPTGEARVVAEDLHFPNGPVVTPDNRTLVVAESWGKRLTAFAIAADGTLSGRRTFADLGDYTPDGITLDAEGAIWVAAFANNAFVRVRDGGEITDVIPTGDRRAVACTLGGADLRTLYGLTFAGEMKDIGKGLRASRIETARVAVPGAGSP
jgi:sugar lactone lactonase YvrE